MRSHVPNMVLLVKEDTLTFLFTVNLFISVCIDGRGKLKKWHIIKQSRAIADTTLRKILVIGSLCGSVVAIFKCN